MPVVRRIGTLVFPGAATSTRQQSENELQGQLHVEWLTRTDTGRAIVVADSVGALTKSAEEVAARRRKVQAIGEIEHLQAELSFQALGHRNVLEYREVHRSKARAGELIAPHRPKASLQRILKRHRVHPLHIGMADQRMRNARVRVTDLVTTVGVLPRAAGIGGCMNGERQTGAERHHGIELPAMGDPLWAVRGARDIVNSVGGEVVAHVVVGIAVVSSQICAVLRERAASLRHIVEVMPPGVRELRRQAVPLTRSESCLKRAVVRDSVRLYLVDYTETRILAEKRPRGLLV